jgi:hypothetical protein
MKNLNLKLFLVCIYLCPFAGFAQFPPAAGQAGSTAIYKDSTVFIAWADGCELFRGWQNIADTSLGKADVGDSSMALGMAGTNGVVSLGDAGFAVLTFDKPIENGESWDFAVFENSFSDLFLELAFVEVSSDGINYFRFPSTSLTDTLTQVGAFDELDPTKINNLAGKYRSLYGTPFDLQELSGVSGLDLNNITHVKIIDIVGSLDSNYVSYDAYNHKINDPWPTPFGSSGFDLDAVGVIHQAPASVPENSEEKIITVYPNPTNGILYITKNNTNLKSAISLTTFKGEIIKEIHSCSLNESIDLSCLPAGIYILKITDTEKVHCEKIIKY